MTAPEENRPLPSNRPSTSDYDDETVTIICALAAIVFGAVCVLLSVWAHSTTTTMADVWISILAGICGLVALFAGLIFGAVHSFTTW